MNSVVTSRWLRNPSFQPETVTDRFARPLRDLRLSVLDRCNLRCTYCMPEDAVRDRGGFLAREQLLSDDELEHLVRVFAGLGVNKLRLTGGEPLLRKGISDLVRRLVRVPGISDLAMTTNGTLLPRHARALREAGLDRLTISLDSLDEQQFKDLSGGRGSVAEVLEGIEAAEQAGFTSLKINTVVQKGKNESGIEDLVDHFRGTGHTLRLIEFMDVGNVNHWSRAGVVPSTDLLKRIHSRWPVRPVARECRSETASRYAFEDGQGEIGFISSITQPFCGNCSRARVTADGTFYHCLFASKGHLLRPLLRQSDDPDKLVSHLRELWQNREDRYSELRVLDPEVPERVEMYRMGG